MFEEASRIKLRFSGAGVGKGTLSTEDLWSLKLEDLDKIAIALNKEVKAESEESFITAKSSVSELVTLKFDIVKHIIKYKLDKAKQAEDASDLKRRKAVILEAMAKKQQEELGNKSVAELEKELAALEAGK